MSINLALDFSVNKENNTITIQKAFNAELPLVWRAFTDPELLEKWWAPKPWKTKSKSMDFRPGGHWIYGMIGPEGEEHWAITNYITIENEKRFTATDGFLDADGNINKEMPQSKWDNNFNSIENGTLVIFYITYNDLAQLEATIQMGFKEGITMTMNSLDEYLITLKK